MVVAFRVISRCIVEWLSEPVRLGLGDEQGAQPHVFEGGAAGEEHGAIGSRQASGDAPGHHLAQLAPHMLGGDDASLQVG